MKWYIGQEIVCIKSHSKNVVIKGEVFTIQGLKNANCKCNEIEIDIGKIFENTTATGLYRCTHCNNVFQDTTSIWWMSEVLFAPLEYNQNAINELLENINVNKL